jgi:hypothetical protein
MKGYQWVDWAFEQEVTGRDSASATTAKFVLVSLAHYVNQDGEGFPGLPAIARDVQRSTRAVQYALDALTAQGLIDDTGKREGRTGRVVVWKLIRQPLHHSETDNGATADGPMAQPPTANGARKANVIRTDQGTDQGTGLHAAPKPPRPRFLTFDALAEVFDIDPATAAKGKAAQIGKAAREIIGLTPWMGGTDRTAPESWLQELHRNSVGIAELADAGEPEGIASYSDRDLHPAAIKGEILRRIRNWPVLFPGRPGQRPPTITIPALAKWWHELDQPERLTPAARDRARDLFSRAR